MRSILSETRFYFAQCVFNTSCHYSAVERIEKQRDCRQTWTIRISATSVVILVATCLAWEQNWVWLLRIISFLSAISTAVSMIFEMFTRSDLTEFICSHKQTAEEYKSLRDRFMDLIRQIMDNKAESIIEPQLQQLLNEYALIGKHSFDTTIDDYNRAQQKLGLQGTGESFTWSNEEIDKFLPEELRLSSMPVYANV